MQRYIARQAIFDRNLHVTGYELLYRAGEDSSKAVFSDGDRATRILLSDALMVFGLNNLTDGRVAYVNFTEKLVLSDFVLLTDPRQITVELLESIHVTERLARRLKELKDRGYRLALDDYTGNPAFDPILPLIDVLKVDFLMTDEKKREEIAAKFRHGRMTLLAEKVENRETYEKALRQGYRMFQGFFFQRPTNMQGEMPGVNIASYMRLLRELNKPDVELRTCAEMIRADAALTFRLLKKVRTLQYYRGNSVQVIERAVAYLGIDELYHWVVLLLARDYNATCTDETVREAYLRGIFTERLMEHAGFCKQKTSGFLVGMFSLMDLIMNRPMKDLLSEVNFPREVERALLNEGDSTLKSFLEFAVSYEKKFAGLPKLNMETDVVFEVYMQCIKDTDWAFRGEK
ncbi:HDOD domain-containing protein [Oscillibacter sp.]|uniref:EAL and HDOD domain-containing protein n=1 Tax=Oscillibacter sp. TaxID=1945593 RepID=UPI00339228D8